MKPEDLEETEEPEQSHESYPISFLGGVPVGGDPEDLSWGLATNSSSTSFVDDGPSEWAKEI